MQFTKTRETTSPTRATSTDAGIDFFVPNLSDEFVTALQEKNPTLKIGLVDKIGRASCRERV